MPVDVMDRLTAALAGERSSGDPEAAPTHGPIRPATRLDTTRPTTPRKPGRGRRSRLTLGALAAVVALVAVGLGFVVKLAGAPAEMSSGSANVASAPDQFKPMNLPGVTITASGTDYTTLNLNSATPPSVPAPLSPTSGAIKSPAGIKAPPGIAAPLNLADVPPALHRLLDPGSLRACLTKIEGLATGTARSVDFATYDGTPAIIVTLESPSSRVAVDADCDPMSPVTTSHS